MIYIPVFHHSATNRMCQMVTSLSFAISLDLHNIIYRKLHGAILVSN